MRGEVPRKGDQEQFESVTVCIAPQMVTLVRNAKEHQKIPIYNQLDIFYNKYSKT